MAKKGAEKRSEQFQKYRINRIANWTPIIDKEYYKFLFPIEEQLLERIVNKLAEGEQAFKPLKYKFSPENNSYNQSIAFILEAIEFFPLKVDLSFDFTWRAFEYYAKSYFLEEKGNSSSVLSKVKMPDAIELVFSLWYKSSLKSDKDFQGVYKELLDVMPFQTAEYIAKRAFKKKENYDNKQHKGLGKKLFRQINEKYGLASDGKITRKIGGLLRLLIKGEEVTIGEKKNKFQLDLQERIKLVIYQGLEVYRNERARGAVFPPFKSSMASLTTYTHAHYMFLWTYILFNQTIYDDGKVGISKEELLDNIRENIAVFKKIYGNHLKK